MDFSLTNIILAIIFAFIVPLLVIMVFEYDEKQFKKDLKEEYDELYRRLDEI